MDLLSHYEYHVYTEFFDPLDQFLARRPFTEVREK